MQDETRFDKSTLLARIGASWSSLQAMLDAQSDADLTDLRDSGGWSAKDHLAHLAAWERGVVFLLNGHAFHDGLGVSQALYEADDLDALNADIQRHVRDRMLEDVRTDLRAVHEQLLGSIQTMTDDQLRTPLDPADTRGRSQPPTLADKIIWNTYEHFDDHRSWIEALIASGRENAVSSSS